MSRSYTTTPELESASRDWFEHVHSQNKARLGRLGILATESGDSIKAGDDNRHLIGPGTRVDKGVYIDRGTLTAISVDFDNDMELQQTYQHIQPAIERVAQASTREEGLRGLATIIGRRYLPYDAEAVIEKYRHDAHEKPDKISFRLLGEFIEDSGGICAQQGLLAAALLERGIKQEKIAGAKAEFVVSYNHKASEAHAFALFTVDDKRWIIDPSESRELSVAAVDSLDYDVEKYGIRK